MSHPLRALAEQVEARTGIWLERGGQIDTLAQRLAAPTADLLPPGGEAALGGPEGRELINALTVNHTWFFRDGEQMRVLAQLLREGWPAGRTVHLWVAGCSTGEDAYSLALLAEEAGRSASILATDINTNALHRAEEGCYGAWALRELPERFRHRVHGVGRQFRVDPALRRSIRFDWHNLVQPPPRPEGAEGWDLVLCRNVLIYFRQERALDTLGRIAAAMLPGGWLFLGSSEVVYGTPAGMEVVQLGRRVALRRSSAGAGPAPRPRPQVQIPVQAEARVRCVPAPLLVPGRVAAGAAAPAPRAEPGERRSRAEPESVRLVTEGNGLLDAGDPAAALERYAAAQGLDPLDAEAHLFAGIALHFLDDPPRAADSLRSALLLDPGLWPAAFYLALCYQNLGHEHGARLQYERLLATVEQPVQLRSRGRLVSDLHAWKQEVRLLARKRLQTLSRARSSSSRSAGRPHGT